MQNAPLVLHLLRYYFRNSTGIFKSYKSTVSKSPGASDRRDVSNVQDRARNANSSFGNANSRRACLPLLCWQCPGQSLARERYQIYMMIPRQRQRTDATGERAATGTWAQQASHSNVGRPGIAPQPHKLAQAHPAESRGSWSRRPTRHGAAPYPVHCVALRDD